MFKYFPPASKKVSHIIVMHHHQYLLQNQRHQFPAAVTALHVALTVAPLCFLSTLVVKPVGRMQSLGFFFVHLYLHLAHSHENNTTPLPGTN